MNVCSAFVILSVSQISDFCRQGFFETKIVTRFWIVSLLLAAITLVTLKIR